MKSHIRDRHRPGQVRQVEIRWKNENERVALIYGGDMGDLHVFLIYLGVSNNLSNLCVHSLLNKLVDRMTSIKTTK